MNAGVTAPRRMVDLALELQPTARALRLSARLLALALVLTVLALYVTPWQQSVPGTGRVIAFAPLERQQTIEAPLAGRIVDWAVAEGQQVAAGELLAVISDNDPELADRLARTRDAAQTRLDMASGSLGVLEEQIAALEAARDASASAADGRIEMALERRAAAEQARDAATATKRANDLNLARQRSLASEGLTSARNLELAELAADTADAELERARASLRAAEGEIKALRAERRRAVAETSADIEKARASLQSARADVAKYEGDLAQREVEVARQHTMRITAPRAGTILRLLAKQGGEFVGAGDPIAVLVPDTESRAAEIWVDGNDAPLVVPGRRVRLQFEGWPAVQFVGWPSVAVGTFAGEVAFVDMTDDGNGRFRVVVVPSSDADEPWPDGAFLRQGVRVNGWILLDRVRLGFELWRQWNGFPPAVRQPPSTGESRAKTSSPKPQASKPEDEP